MSKLINAVINEITDNLANGDETALEELLKQLTELDLISFLPEDKWAEHGNKHIIDTEMKYLSDGACHCPECNSTDIKAGEHEPEGGAIFIPVECNDCKSKWDDCYTLTGAIIKNAN
jgi:hypothetical protein